MAIPLKYNTASQEIPLGFFVDKTDGSTAETGLTIANTDIKLWKNGATTLANKNSGGATHISGGIYYCTLDTSDTDTYGLMKIFCHITAEALPVILECLVMEANAYDALYAALGTGYIETNENDIADAILLRSVSNTEGTAGDHTLTALILATLESSASSTTWTIRKTGGTTFLTKTLTLDAAASPVIGVT